MKGIFFLSVFSPAVFSFAQQQKDSIYEIDEVKVVKKLPITTQVIKIEKKIQRKNLGQDLPYLLKNETGVESTSDAGNAIGYTSLRIRGVDGSRINVMLNGVPYNDSESQSSFFVNMADVTSSASHVIIQRGVGTSSNGTASFGASLNIITRDPEKRAYFSTQNSVGSFSTHKHSFEIGTGSLMEGKLSWMGRYSIIKSDGYIDRAASDLSSYNFLVLYQAGNTKIRFQSFGGKEKTYQAWQGLSREQYQRNPRYNTAGEIYDKQGKVTGFYDNETDNYQQRHYHWLWQQRFSDQWNFNTTLYYTRGLGYYENYKSNEKLSKYGISPFIKGSDTISKADVIRRKWLDNDFYGLVSELNGRFRRWDLNFGLIVNQYEGRHYGQVIKAQYVADIALPYEYYRNKATKNEASSYAKALYRLGKLQIFADLQLRNIHYHSNIIKASAGETPFFNEKYMFFNPKLGVNYSLKEGTFYLSYAQAHREPARGDILNNPDVRPEILHDFEWGYNKDFGDLSLSANTYYMLYKDQLILTGTLNDVGAALRQNIPNSYRVGLELGGSYVFTEKFNALMNVSFSQNKNRNYIVNISKGEIKNLGTTNISFSPSFMGNITLNYLPIKDLQLSWVNKKVGSQYLDNSQSAEQKLKPYYLSDFIASYHVVVGKIEIDCSLLVNNLFNYKYTNNGYVGPYYYAQAGTNLLAGIALKFY
ncbi:outer membrane beta-barrel protein [Elizabethkingia argentiflava]|uniref:Outer membrane beta-barrel protein n=1 Tax=Elizabethkingia argenteiflava TaxID=2681556 RepID=A0A845PZX1_9FLAO|nr:TonB-dependent receptor plug domain-containing protein [Elizabethkingia argenteiflava]NAW51987.1 outer membrane beta-barrel protein [Elizabethkingia argenteiflava]